MLHHRFAGSNPAPFANNTVSSIAHLCHEQLVFYPHICHDFLMDEKQKRPPGRPTELVMPEPIPDTPENVARACMQGPPKQDWDYLKPGSDAKREPE